MDFRSPNFLEVTDDRPYEQIALQAAAELDKLYPTLDQPLAQIVKPEPGFCIKTKDDNQKVFINVCYSSQLPKPADITEEELFSILQSDEPSSYRVPMSLGEPHYETDKGGQPCVAYDVIVNNEYFNKIKDNELFKTFLMNLCVEGLEEKYGIQMNKDSCIVLKNKKYHGSMPEHFIKTYPKQLITEVDSSEKSVKPSKSPSTKPPISKRKEEEKKAVSTPTAVPKFTIFKYPATDSPELLVAKFCLPEVTSKDIKVDLGEDRIILQTTSDTYAADIFLPYLVDHNASKAHFHIMKQVLMIVMPVIGKVNI